MHYKQKQNYGCGLYAVANILQYDSFITDDRLFQSQKGNNLGQLTKWLIEDYNICISVIKYNNENPISIFDLKPKLEDDNLVSWMPFFIVIQSSNRLNHMIGCRYMRNGNIIVHDSLKEEPDVFNRFSLFKKHYKGKILSFEMLRDMNGVDISIVEK